MQLNFAALHVPQLMVTTFLTLMALIALDTLLGLIQALVKGKWQWSYVAHFMETSVLPYLGGLLGLALLALIEPSMQAAFYTSASGIAIKFIADIVSKLNGFGIQVNDPPTTISSPAPGGSTTVSNGTTVTK